MNLSLELESKGWHISHAGLELCKEGLNTPTVSGIISKALDIDLREIGGNFFAEEINRGKLESISGPAVIQIQKIKNATAPKYEYGSGAPPILRLLLTDGNIFVNCLQWGQWKSISMDTPPGTKIYLKPGKIAIQNNFLLLNEHQFTVLGGCVAPLVEKWELCMQLASHVRTKGDLDGNGPPPWIPFGKPINTEKPLKGKNFRSLDTESKEVKEEDEAFKQQRLANIAEVSRVKEGKPKVFGGGKEVKQANSKSESSNFTNILHNNSNDTSNFTYNPKYQRNFNDHENKYSPRNQTEDKFPRNNTRTGRTWTNQEHKNQATNENSYQDQSYNKDKRFDQNSYQDQSYNKDKRFDQNSYQDQSYNKDKRFDQNSYQDQSYNKDKRFDQNSYQDQSYNKDKRFDQNSYQDQSYNKDKRFDQRNKYNTSDSQNSRNQGNYSQRSYSNNDSNNYRANDGNNTSRKFNRTNYNEHSRFTDKSGNSSTNDIEDVTQQFSQIKFHGYDNRNSSAVVVPNKPYLKPGTEVMAKYWEDEKFYRAVVHAVGDEGTTCVVFFQEYGNYEEVLIKDVQQAQSKWNAGPFTFQPSHWENKEKSQSYRNSSDQNNSHRSYGQSYQRYEKQKNPRQDTRPAAKLYQPPQQRQT